jgi:hypothetical protein
MRGGEAFLVRYPGVFGPRPRVGAGLGALRKAIVNEGQAGPAEQCTLLLQRLVGPLWVVGALVTPAGVQPPTMAGHLLWAKKKGGGFGFGFGFGFGLRQRQEPKKSA